MIIRKSWLRRSRKSSIRSGLKDPHKPIATVFEIFRGEELTP
jgi:hypothetical protein